MERTQRHWHARERICVGTIEPLVCVSLPHSRRHDPTVGCALSNDAFREYGVDVSFSATVRCNEGPVMSVSGTSLLGGNAHSDPPVPKEARIDVFGTHGSLHYGGNDREANSGKLEFKDKEGNVEVLHDEFHFENLENSGDGPESLREFVRLCDGEKSMESGANVTDGLRSIQTIDAMYRSHASSQVEPVLQA
mmetsp:Transcript_12882/g.12988  ORF Transcript_12882/g.12988 Transcript_12882/m.12988 type:complete len:193 (-) Transcript_12882:251-829(-)